MTHRPRSALATASLAVWIPLAGVGACSSDEGGVPKCVPGRVASCPCASGGEGTQTCSADGVFGACVCAPDRDASGSDAIGEVVDATVGRDATPIVDATGNDTLPAGDIPVSVDDAAADGADASDHCDPCGYGGLRGRACSPSLEVDVPNATVTLTAVDCDGVARTYTTTTAANGVFELPAIPCGTHDVHVESGAFSRDYTVQVVAGQMNDESGAAVKVCFGGSRVPIAVFWGQWDGLEDLLTDLGLDHTFYDFEADYFAGTPAEDIEAVQVLRDPAKLAAYKILFFDCGSAALEWVREFPEIAENIRAFVLAGGSLYASDLAWAYVEAAFPDAIDFYGSDDLPHEPQAPDGPQHVQGQQDYPATVGDATLAAYLGTGAFTTRYGPGPLIAVDAAGSGTLVEVKGIVHVDLPPASCGDGICDPSEVLMCQDCAGRLVPDEFIQHAGPMVLVHRPTATSGRVIFTTFHNDEQADALERKLLHYLVFQL